MEREPDPIAGSIDLDPDWAFTVDANIRNAAAIVRLNLKFMSDLF